MRDNEPRLMPGGVAAVRSLLVPSALVLAFVLALLATPALAFAQTEAPGFVYAQSIRGHRIAVNWEPPLRENGTDQNMLYRIYRAEGDVLPAFDPAVEPGTHWTLAGTQEGYTKNSFCDDSPKKSSTRYWYVITAQSASPAKAESLASPVNSPHMYGGDRGQWYYYRPANDANEDSYQWYIGATTQPPLEPTDVQITGADDTITLSWTAPLSTNISHYNIYREDSSGNGGVLIGSVDAPLTEFVDQPVGVYQHYWYTVAAVDDEGNEGRLSIEKHYRTVASTGPESPHTGNQDARDAETCSVCHAAHDAPVAKLLKSEHGTDVALCLTCHDGTGSQFDVRGEYLYELDEEGQPREHFSAHRVTIYPNEAERGEHPTDTPLVEGGEYGFVCVDCHTAHGGAQPSPKMLSVDGATSGNAVCYGSGCHGPVDPHNFGKDDYLFDFEQAFEVSVHNTDIADPESGTEVRCSTCHQPHASPNEWLWNYSEYNACFQCHANGQDSIYARITLRDDPDTSHDVLRSAQEANDTYMACQHCHNTHAVTSEKPLVDPWSPGIMPGEQWDEDRDAPLAVADGPDSHLLPRYNRFCFSCHGTAGLPQAEDTLPWVDPPDDAGILAKNIETDWALDGRVHGLGSAGGAVLDEDVMGYENGQTLSCMTCHEPHGTINNYNLRGDVPALDGTFPKNRMLLVQNLSGPTTPVDGAFDTRFFCSSCHLYVYDPGDPSDPLASPPDHMRTEGGAQSQARSYYFFPSGCTNTACHMHGSTGNRRF